MPVLPWLDHVAQLPECKFKVTRDPLTATFTYPGLNFSNFDRNNMADVISLIQHADDAMTFALNYPYKKDEDKWVDWIEVRRDCLLFMLSLEIVISREMYDMLVPKWLFEARAVLGYVGNSTATFPVELYVPGSKYPLLTQTCQLATVEKNTRKTHPFPDWFRNTCKGQCSMETGFRLKPFPRPEETFMCKREVLWLETDANAHTSFVSYVRYALDGLHSALRHLSRGETAKGTSHQLHTRTESMYNSDTSGASHPNFTSDLIPRDNSGQSGGLCESSVTTSQTKYSQRALKGMSNNIIMEGLKSLRICYISECVEGDILDVHIWQEEKEEFVVRCSVEKGTRLICQLVLEYFSPLAKL